MAHAFGSSCGSGLTFAEKLSSNEPTLGNRSFTLEITNAAASSAAVIGVATASTVRRIYGTCDLYLADPIIPLATSTNLFGVARVGWPIPVSPSLRGLTLFAQGFIADARIGVAFTQGRRLIVGD